jgi:hypothetical protein
MQVADLKERGHMDEDAIIMDPAEAALVDCASATQRGQTEPEAGDPEVRSEMVTEAHRYADAGCHVIQLKPRTKEPVGSWTGRIPANEIDAHFSGEANLAIAFGACSNGRVDVDLDWHEAARVADHVIKWYPAFGRPGSPRSHRMVICKEALEADGPCRIRQFKLPATMKGDPRLPSDHGVCVVEVRGNGHYTMLPPSIHPNGEKLSWDSSGIPTPPIEKWDDVVANAGIVAFLALCVRLYPPLGYRHDFCMALTGTLLRTLMNADDFKEEEQHLVNTVNSLVHLVGELAGGGKSHKLTHAANTLTRIKDGQRTYGLKTALKLLGIPEDGLPAIAGWLGNLSIDERPRIRYDERELTDVIIKTDAALRVADAPIYQMGGRIVHTLRLDKEEIDSTEDKNAVRRKEGALMIRAIENPRMWGYFNDYICFTKEVISKKGVAREIPAPCPRSLASDFKAYTDKWRLRVLRGTIECPTLRADGSLLSEDGYDEASGLILDTGGIKYPAIPDAPTLDEALAALTTLKDLLVGFPFVDDGKLNSEKAVPTDLFAQAAPAKPSASRSVALSAILTALVRRSLRTAPLHGFTATTPGTGKTLLANVPSLIATGREAAAMSQGGDETEDEKRLLGVLMQGDPILLIDNMTRPLQGDALCSILSEETWQGRVLGSTGQVHVPTNVLLMATGNNLVIAGDMVRRAIKCSLDAGLEKPEERSFDVDLTKVIPHRRPELVAAGLIILRAFIHAGRPLPQDLIPFGKFEDWSNLVRGALIWLGEADPCETRKSILDHDPTHNIFAALIVAIVDRTDVGLGIGYAFTAQDLVIHAGAPQNADLKAALDTIMPKAHSAVSLGRYLSKHDGKIVDGYRLREFKESGTAKFKIDALPAS